MKNRNKRREQRIRKMIVACALCAIILAASTYAWFIGMRTVNVSSFDVEIAAIDGLSLSINGSTWSDTININSENYSTDAYSGNTNSWGGSGLVPMSSVGDIDTAASRLKLYEKGSLTTTPGGYRIMATRVHNFETEGDALVDEQDGYVVFDLFVKNLSGTEYYSEYNVLNEEAIYLTTDSSVKVATDGGVAGTGIENSVRVAFAQIGRIKATTTDAATITGITCATAGGVTGICQRTAQIWEPNDRAHVQNAINWYTTSCKKRTSAEITSDAYSTACNEVKDGAYYQTYAISGRIDYTDKVDVYDGADYNTWTGTTSTTGSSNGKLVAYDYFTDSEKNLTGMARPTFITLAPNSITKIRIYIYIEGQDVDNYDFASLGRKISVAFGFTKERFMDTDVDYDDENTATLPTDVVRENHPLNIYPSPTE